MTSARARWRAVGAESSCFMTPATAVAVAAWRWAGAMASTSPRRRFAIISLLRPGTHSRPGRRASAVRGADVVDMKHLAGARRDALAALVILDMHERLDPCIDLVPGPHGAQEWRRAGGSEQPQDAIRLGDAQFALKVFEPILHQTFFVEHEAVEEAFARAWGQGVQRGCGAGQAEVRSQVLARLHIGQFIGKDTAELGIRALQACMS